MSRRNGYSEVLGSVYLDQPANQSKPGISLGIVEYAKRDGFIKCEWLDENINSERNAYNILKSVQTEYVQQPLTTFTFANPYEDDGDFIQCYVYTRAEGDNLDEFLTNKSWDEKAMYLPIIFGQVIKGNTYLRHANIAHSDIKGANIMVYKAPTGGINTMLVDYDDALLLSSKINNVLVTKKLSNLNELNTPESIRNCRMDDMKFSRAIYKAITGAYPPLPNTGLDNEALASLLNNVMLVISQGGSTAGNGVRASFGAKYKDFENNIPQYPNTAKAASALLPLMKTMMLLTSNRQANCMIPIDPSYRIA
ncbi:hypothetical protein BDF22DRAFT_662248 [Syncephalis plumigaleata]|nr:hypothetical protein BDF22DRAFT_662248 [Syncephalis plumigaleata]